MNSAKVPPSSNNNFNSKNINNMISGNSGTGVRKSEISGVPKLPKVGTSTSNVSNSNIGKKGDVVSGTIVSIGTGTSIGN